MKKSFHKNQENITMRTISLTLDINIQSHPQCPSYQQQFRIDDSPPAPGWIWVNKMAKIEKIRPILAQNKSIEFDLYF